MVKILTIDRDERLNATCVTARAPYSWFLKVTSGAEENLSIQRRIIKGTKSYATLRHDLKLGCILPPLVLAAKNLSVPGGVMDLSVDSARPSAQKALAKLETSLANISPDDVFIIDGLQRTNALRQTRDDLSGEDRKHFLARHVRFEVWLNIPFGAIAYRMLLLNAGQKPMSIKHQVEVLSMNLRDDLKSIPGMEIITTLDQRRRTKPGQFQLAKLSQAFQAWLQGQPNVDVSNVVMQQLLAEGAIETLSASLEGEHTTRHDKKFDSFLELASWLVKADILLGEANLEFLGAETVLQGIAAAVGAAERNPAMRKRMKKALPRLVDGQGKKKKIDDPLAVGAFNSLREGMNPTKRNVGIATREMVFQAFQEYFSQDGKKSMEECWRFAASRA